MISSGSCASYDSSNVSGICCDFTMEKNFGSPFFKKNLAVVAIDEAHCIAEW